MKPVHGELDFVNCCGWIADTWEAREESKPRRIYVAKSRCILVRLAGKGGLGSVVAENAGTRCRDGEDGRLYAHPVH